MRAAVVRRSRRLPPGRGWSPGLASPAGSPASTMHSASLMAQMAVLGAGAHTTALPLASAGASHFSRHFIRPIPGGDDADHAARHAAAKTLACWRPPRPACWPSSRLPSAAAILKYSMTSSTSTYASACSGLPWSSVSICASASRAALDHVGDRGAASPRARSAVSRGPAVGRAARRRRCARRASSRSPCDDRAERLARRRAAWPQRPDPRSASNQSPPMNRRVDGRCAGHERDMSDWRPRRVQCTSVAEFLQRPRALRRRRRAHARGDRARAPRSSSTPARTTIVGRCEAPPRSTCMSSVRVASSSSSTAACCDLHGRGRDVRLRLRSCPRTRRISSRRAAQDTLIYRIPADVMRPALQRPAFIALRHSGDEQARPPARRPSRPRPGPPLPGRPVAELIRAPALVCGPATSVQEAARRMAEVGATCVRRRHG